jgi:hypothetical protein
MYCVFLSYCREAYGCSAVVEFSSHISMPVERQVVRAFTAWLFTTKTFCADIIEKACVKTDNFIETYFLGRFVSSCAPLRGKKGANITYLECIIVESLIRMSTLSFEGL